jgi:hypothetical protein
MISHNPDFESFQVGVDTWPDWWVRAEEDGVIRVTALGDYEIDGADDSFTVTTGDWVTIQEDGEIVPYDESDGG